jgi:protein SCO1
VAGNDQTELGAGIWFTNNGIMKPNSSSSEHLARMVAADPVQSGEATESTWRRQEVLATLALGLVVTVVAASVAFLTSRREWPGSTATRLDRSRHLVDFHLLDRSGRSVTKADLEGRFVVVNFVFTGCSLSCRAVNDRMEELQRLVANQTDIRLVSVTVDPRTDTPTVLTKFADGYHANRNRWLFLTGDKAEVYRLIETSFLPKSPELEGLIPGGFGGTDRIMLVDPRGYVCASFNGLKRTVAGEIVAEIDQRRRPTHL